MDIRGMDSESTDGAAVTVDVTAAVATVLLLLLLFLWFLWPLLLLSLVVELLVFNCSLYLQAFITL